MFALKIQPRPQHMESCCAVLVSVNKTTLGVEESKQLSAQLSVGHGLCEKGVLLCQLLRCKVLRLPCHPVVVVQQGKKRSVGGFGEQRALIKELEQTESNNKTT